eukprot:877027-Amphidinium_carterae.1
MPRKEATRQNPTKSIPLGTKLPPQRCDTLAWHDPTYGGRLLIRKAEASTYLVYAKRSTLRCQVLLHFTEAKVETLNNAVRFEELLIRPRKRRKTPSEIP